MARIPLRSYNREIENLIDRGQIEEAIAHAQNILKQYPKHIETYRLLGKAYLESQRYTEASDILQRVLSVLPDDFVAQLGMSIIREDEGNLDAAIWHMERAYEVQPFNRAVQDELRRLYGRRDGSQPPRIRLTRGSLVRMYARGELYPQAIAEIRAALSEDAQRLDLSVLLARMYYLSGLKVEAAEIASSLISKLPFCFEANKILMDILPQTSRAEESLAFQRRIFDLDPYAEFTTPNAPTSDQVPEQTVIVEHIDWQPSAQDSQSPDWAKTIGRQWEETKEDDLPDWLNSISSVPTQSQPPSPVGSAPADLMPDFMRDAGWGISTNPESHQDPAAFEADSSPSESLEVAEMPAWLQSMAPELTPVEPAQEADQLNWLSSILPDPAGENSAVADFAPSFDPNEPDLTWLSAPSTPPPAEQTGEAIPSDSTQVTAKADLASDSLPDWLLELENAGDQSAPASLPDMPDLSTFAELTVPPSAEEPVPTESEIDPFAWLQTPEDDNAPDAIPSWLTEAALPPAEAEAEAPAQLPEIPPTASIDSPSDPVPDWLVELTGETADFQANDFAETPQWQSDLAETDVADFASPVTDDLANLDWLREEDLTSALTQPENPGEAEPLVENEPPTADSPASIPETSPLAFSDIPEPEAIFAEDESDSTPTAESASLPTVPETAPESKINSDSIMPDLDDMDAAMAWLEGLAARQHAEIDSQRKTTPEPQSGQAHVWITNAQTPSENTPPQRGPLDDLTEDEDLPDWLRDDIPLSDFADLNSQGTDLADIADPAQAVVHAENSEFYTETLPAESPLVSPPQELNFWQETLAATDASVPPPSGHEEEPASAAIPELDDIDSAMAWLEALATKQGAQSDTLTITNPELRTETPPDWISQLSNENLASIPLAEIDAPNAAETDANTFSAPAEEHLAALDLAAEELPPLASTTTNPTEALGSWAEEDAEDLAEYTYDSADAPAEASPLESPAVIPLPADHLQEITPSAPDLNDLDSAMAWLEALAAKQGADMDTLQITPVEERSETLPDWISSLAEKEQTLEAVAPEFSPPQDLMEAPDVTTPDIVQAEELPPPASLPPHSAAPDVASIDPDIPDWLLNYEADLQVSSGIAETQVTPSQTPAPEESITLWLQQNHPEPLSEAAEAGQASPESPEAANVLQGYQAVPRSEETPQKAPQPSQPAAVELPPSIQLLRAAIDHSPDDFSLWQSLGDAYMQANQIQEALDAFTKAEELLR